MSMNIETLVYWFTINVYFEQHVSTICQKAYTATNVLFPVLQYRQC